MTLALDLGNSALKAALFEDDHAVLSATFPFSQADWQPALSAWLADLRGVELVGLATVVPSATPAVLTAVRAAGLPAPLHVHAALPLPLRMAYATPDTLGADRIAGAVAAWLRFGPGRPLLVLDAGTAVTYEAVSADGTYAGGAIAPGPQLLVASLYRGTAQLPIVPFDEPPAPVGDSTLSALQSGLVYGFLGGTRETLARIRTWLGPDTYVVATGGWADWIARRVEGIHAIRPLLVLEGVRDIVRHAAEAPR